MTTRIEVGSPPTEPDASVIVPSYRGAERLGVLLESLRAQRFGGDWELIVVVDGDVDGSVQVLRAATDLALTVLVFEANRGRPAALNAGFDAARGRVLIRCDDDLQPGVSYVADHVLAHCGTEPVGAVGLYRNHFGATPYARAYGRRYDASVRAGAYQGTLGDERFFWAGNCSVTRATHDRVGPYDEQFRAYGWEDIDWGFRLAAAGVRIVLDPRLETVHHAANNDTVTRLRRAYSSGVARVRFDAKHGTSYAPEPGPGLKGRAWHAAVTAAADRATPDRLARWGARIDTALTWVPPALGYRLVAGAVDAAAMAGYRAGQAADTDDPVGPGTQNGSTGQATTGGGAR